MPIPSTANYTKLVGALDLSDLPANEQEEILLDLNDAVFKTSLLKMIEVMTEEQREALAKLMETEASEEELEAFLSANVPGAEQMVQEAIASIADDILAVSDDDE